MELRFIKEEEQEQAIFILSQAYFYDCANEYKSFKKGKFKFKEFLGVFDDSNKLVATLQCLPYFMWLDGVSVSSGGLGNIATLPENRRMGLVRQMIKHICDKMYNDGCIMSYLYPFSHTYYRKFGYELCCEMLRLEASPDNLKNIPFDGNAKQFEPGGNGTDPGDIIDIYNAFSKKYNIMHDRDAWQWEEKLEHDPVETKTRTYVIYDKKNTAQAYFTYTYERIGFPAEITIKDLAWINSDAMYMLFAFIKILSANVTKIKLHMPPEIEVSYLFEEPQDCEMFYKPSGMARVINAKEALKTIKKPTSEGTFTIKINDSFMEQNNKSYKVSWTNEKTIVQEFEGECDLECSAKALAQIITGFVGIEQAQMRDDLVINSNRNLLAETFPQKMVYIADFF